LGRLLRHYVSDTWSDQVVRERLSWYYDVLRDLRPSKFLICKEVACEHDPGLMTETQLWQEHDGLRLEFLNRLREFKEGEILSERFQKPEFSFLDVKVELLNRILRKCVLTSENWIWRRRRRIERRLSSAGASDGGIWTTFQGITPSATCLAFIT